jgi:hypothetical protein
MRKIVDVAVLILLVAIIVAIAYIYRKAGTCMIDPTLERLRRDLIKVDPQASRLQFFPADESFTEDKQKVFICMKDENGNYYPYNTLLAVCLHELAHALCPIVDKQHVTPEFNNIHKGDPIGNLSP